MPPRRPPGWQAILRASPTQTPNCSGTDQMREMNYQMGHAGDRDDVPERGRWWLVNDRPVTTPHQIGRGESSSGLRFDELVDQRMD
jgi:hypothetical protein